LAVASASTLTPAVVVVDSRNFWGASRRQFGAGRRIVVGGVVEALRPYGFDVVDVYVGIATTTTASNPSARLSRGLEANAAFAATVNASPIGHALVGRLIERRRSVQEKLVDVLCAMQIARSAHEIAAGRTRAQAIVVLSEDMDLIPAYEFAQDLGVPIYAAANATVDTRPDSSWLLLGENAIRISCEGAHGRFYGHQLRQEISTWLTTAAASRMSFKVRSWDPHGSRLRLIHERTGAGGIWHDPPDSADRTVGATHALFVVGLQPGTPKRDFPVVTLRPTRERELPWPPPSLATAIVREWESPTRVVAMLPHGPTQTLSATIGTLLPGDRILVHEDSGQLPGGAWRLIGRLEPRAQTPGRSDPTIPALARVITGATSSGQRVRAELVGSAATVTLQPPGTDTSQIGDLYAVVPIAHVPLPPERDGVVTIAVSSRLAPPRA